MKYTYEDLAERWNVSVGALKVRKHRGQLPEPDEQVIIDGTGGVRYYWYEETIKQMEETDGKPRSSSKGAAATD